MPNTKKKLKKDLKNVDKNKKTGYTTIKAICFVILNQKTTSFSQQRGVFVNYKPLSSLYYENKSEYESVYNARFFGENCVHLNFKIHENEAFYCITEEMHKLYIKILELNTDVLQKLSALPGIAPKQFAKRSLIEEIVLTNNIEGVFSTRKEIGNVLESLKSGDKKKRFFGLVKKYNMLASEEIPLKTPEDIRKVYDELVLPEIAADDPGNIPDGELFRKDGTEVTSKTQKVIHTGVYPEAKIISAMEKALNILNSDLSPIERISVFHYLFGYIHPFYDGNGRTSRFISSYLLARELHNGLIGYRISYTIKENLSAYYDAFKLCNDPKSRGDITPFVLMFMDIICKSMLNLQKALHERIQKLHFFSDKMAALPSFQTEAMQNFGFLLIQARLFSEHGITKKELEQLLKIGTVTLDKRINAVREEGLLLEERVERRLYFKFDIDKLQ